MIQKRTFICRSRMSYTNLVDLTCDDDDVVAVVPIVVPPPVSVVPHIGVPTSQKELVVDLTDLPDSPLIQLGAHKADVLKPSSSNKITNYFGRSPVPPAKKARGFIVPSAISNTFESTRWTFSYRSKQSTSERSFWTT